MTEAQFSLLCVQIFVAASFVGADRDGRGFSLICAMLWMISFIFYKVTA